jgi:hypothetical protein
MSAFDHPLLRVIGISWFREEDYAAIRAISEDGHKMPSKWKDWLKGAEEMEQKAIQSGKVVERVNIDPDTFPDWCKKNGVGVNRQGRHKFIAMAVGPKHGNQS